MVGLRHLPGALEKKKKKENKSPQFPLIVSLMAFAVLQTSLTTHTINSLV